MIPGDEIHEACGLFGVCSLVLEAADIAYYGISALQHRGQESAGIGVASPEGLRVTRGMGLVADVMTESAMAAVAHGRFAIGHTRYSTTGATILGNAQPMEFHHPTLGPFMVAHNGNLTNATELRAEMSDAGVAFENSSDTELLGRLVERTPGDDLVAILQQALPRTEAAYCLVFLLADRIVAVRDPLGIRPLCLGRLGDRSRPGGDGFIVASESCALDVVGAELIREVEPGEIITITEAGVQSTFLPQRLGVPRRRAMCSFEFIYFARPDSVMMGRSLYEARHAMGRELAREAPVDADIVITLPDSGTPAAIGYAEEAGMRFVEGLMKSRYVQRTFIQPRQSLRDASIRLKFNPMPHVLGGRRVVLVDDSIVRGTTTRRIADDIRRAGASEVHLRIASPPLAWPCFMGIDIATRNELIAAQYGEEEIGRLVGADSLRYLSIDGLRRAMGRPDGDGFCFACFTGKYPVTVGVSGSPAPAAEVAGRGVRPVADA